MPILGEIDGKSVFRLVCKLSSCPHYYYSRNDGFVEKVVEKSKLSIQITITMVSKSTYSPKVLELVAKEVANYFTGTEIIQILTEFGMARDDIQYPNTKWWTINEAFKYIKVKREDPEGSISKLIMDFLHPLNHNLDEKSSEALVNKIEKYLKYDKFYIQDTGAEYLVLSDEEMEEIHSIAPEIIEEDKRNKILYDQKIKDGKEVIRKLRDSHQSYMDVVELFCRNPKKPTKELNDAYLFLSRKIEAVIKEMNLGYYGVSFYKPFKNDLYSAEIEWNGTGRIDDFRLGPTLSWDAIRPSLYRAHSGILRVQSLSEEESKMTDDDKKLEDINTLISQARTPVSRPVSKIPVHKIEITNSELVFRNAEETAITKGKKRIHLPHFKSTDWSKITIRFVDERNVIIQADSKQITSDFEALGFADGKKNKPDSVWAFLLGLAKNNGETKKLSTPIPDTIRQQKRKLTERLRKVFKNDSEPFYDPTETQTYRIKINLIPPQLEEARPAYNPSELLEDLS